MAAKKPIIEIEDDDDETFLSLAMAAEAEALASKRRRITPPSSGPTGSVANLVSDDQINDGLYMAALKGNQTIAIPRVTGLENVSGGGGGGGSCFKCGKLGHWARDCDSGGQSGNFISGSISDSTIAEKNCSCGLGLCLVLTANTEKNPGRKFYKCPARQENGGCGFFEWCDSASSGPNSMAGGSYGSNSSLYPGLDCPCGAGLCLILTAKTGKNVGQQFYRCPSNEGSSCGFFKWCNENSQSPVFSASKVYGNSSNTNANNTTNYTSKTGSSSSTCFKCGKEGHWARDCPSTPSSNPSPQFGGSASSGSCFKCGKPGHWSRDCTFA